MRILRSLFARLRTGLLLAKGSFGVLRRRKWLLTFPVLYGLTWLVGLAALVGGLLAALVGAGYGLALVDQVASVSEGAGENVAAAIVLAASALFMFVATSIATFFSAALVHAVGKTFAGEPTGVRDGLAGAWESRRTILAWGVVGATVGLVVRLLEGREGVAAGLVRSTIGFAWSAMTFFIVPVIVFQDGDLRESVGSSLELFRRTWGEAGGIHLGIGLVIVPIAALVGLAGIGLPMFVLEDPWSVLTYTLVPTLLVVGALVVVNQAATGIATTALYRYATGGSLPPEFDGVDPEDLVGEESGASGPADVAGGRTGRI